MATISSNSSYGYQLTGNHMDFHTEYTHHSNIDRSSIYGKALGFPRRGGIGGDYTWSTSCGSRSFAADGNTARTTFIYS